MMMNNNSRGKEKLKDYAMDDLKLESKLLEIKNANGNDNLLRKICLVFYADCSYSLSNLTSRLGQIKAISNKIKSSRGINNQDKEYYLKIFKLFKHDHSARINVLNNKWKEARDDYKYLFDNGGSLLSYYNNKNWVERYLNYSSVMVMIQDGKSRDDIQKTPEYRYILPFRECMEEFSPEVTPFMDVPPFEKVTIKDGEICSICTEDLQNNDNEPVKSTFCNCNYFYHKDCIEKAIRITYGGKAKCPICKAEFEPI